MAASRLKEHVIERAWCKGCGICVHFCPKDVLVLDAEDKVMVVGAKDCIGCRQCELRCPDLAIEVVLADAPVKAKAKAKGEAGGKANGKNGS
jgi:2-oxoglutarate ferredoxin oxidoreductase subunit delta